MVNQSLKIATAVLVLFTFLVSGSYALDKGEAFFGFTEDPINSRAIGMGAAGSGLSGNGGYGFYNPALPALNKKPYFSFDFARQYGDLGRANAELSWIFEKWFIGAGFLSQSTGNFKITTEQGIIDGATGSDQSTMAFLNTGFISGNFALGITLNGIQDKIFEYTSYGVSGSIGAVYTIFPDQLYIGAAVLHAGKNSSFLDTTHALHKQKMPLTVRGGLSWSDTIRGRLPYTCAFDVVYSQNYRTVMVPVGLEVWPHPALALRVGKRFNFNSDLFSLGLGLRFSNIGFDAAFTPTKTVSDLGIKGSVGLSYYLPSIKKKTNSQKAEVITKNTDTSTQKTPVANQDTIAGYKAPVERKIIRKKTADTISVQIDTTKSDSIQPSPIDSVPAQKNGISVPDTSDVPADTTAKIGTVGATISQDSSVTVKQNEPADSFFEGVRTDSSETLIAVPDSSSAEIRKPEISNLPDSIR